MLLTQIECREENEERILHFIPYTQFELVTCSLSYSPFPRMLPAEGMVETPCSLRTAKWSFNSSIIFKSSM